jgi:hypothetical protein
MKHSHTALMFERYIGIDYSGAQTPTSSLAQVSRDAFALWYPDPIPGSTTS